jgi:nucleotide-binding universal stress UspA family protein
VIAENVASILLLVERGDQGHQALSKALLLARHLHAALDLFLCDTERYPSARSGAGQLPPAAARTRVADAGEYLQVLRKSINAPEVELSSDAVCHVSLRTALADKLRRSRVDLVVKAGQATPAGRDDRDCIDWPLVASCTAPLLLTRGRPWHPVPRFVAVVDLLDRQGSALCSAIMALAGTLSRGCAAELETLFAHPARQSEFEAGRQAAAREDFVARAYGGDAQRFRQLPGEPSEVLPRLVAQRDYDLVVMGKPRHGAPSDASRSVAANVLRATAGDVLFMQPFEEASCLQLRARPPGS